MTASGKTLADNLKGIEIKDHDVITSFNKPLRLLVTFETLSLQYKYSASTYSTLNE